MDERNASVAVDQPSARTADEITGELVHQQMWRRKISQREVGLAIGVNQGALGRKLRGERKWTLDEVLAVAAFLQVEVSDLLPTPSYEPKPYGNRRGVARTELAASGERNSPTSEYVRNGADLAVVDLEERRSRRPHQVTYPRPQRLADVVAIGAGAR